MNSKTAFDVALSCISTDNSRGLSPYAALEASWLTTAILMGLRNEPWKNPIPLRVLDNKRPPYIDIWISLNLAYEVGSLTDMECGPYQLKLTEKGNNIVRLKGLFEYEHSMIEQQLSGNYKTDPEKYRNLRKALATYSEIYLTKTVSHMLSFIKKNHNVLDYGGGTGYYLIQAMGKAIEGSGVLLDKAPELGFVSETVGPIKVKQHNFANNDIFQTDFYKEQFDFVIFSEVAHCLSQEQLTQSLSNIHTVLKPNGKLFIIEQLENFRLEQRLFDMTKGGTLYDKFDIYHALIKAGFADIKPPLVDNSHFSIITEKNNDKMYQK